MKSPFSTLTLVAAIGVLPLLAQAPSTEPTKQEIAEAYRSKSGGLATFLIRHDRERWRIKEIRGWKLRLRRTSESHSPGVTTRKYVALAEKNGSCAEYGITDTITSPPPNPQMPPLLVVAPYGVRACR